MSASSALRVAMPTARGSAASPRCASASRRVTSSARRLGAGSTGSTSSRASSSRSPSAGVRELLLGLGRPGGEHAESPSPGELDRRQPEGRLADPGLTLEQDDYRPGSRLLDECPEERQLLHPADDVDHHPSVQGMVPAARAIRQPRGLVDDLRAAPASARTPPAPSLRRRRRRRCAAPVMGLFSLTRGGTFGGCRAGSASGRSSPGCGWSGWSRRAGWARSTSRPTPRSTAGWRSRWWPRRWRPIRATASGSCARRGWRPASSIRRSCRCTRPVRATVSCTWRCGSWTAARSPTGSPTDGALPPARRCGC